MYIHRVGRTARAGRAGKSILVTTQYDVEFIQRLEKVLNRQLDLYPHDEAELEILRDRVDEAGRVATNQIQEEDAGKGQKGRQKHRHNAVARDNRDRDDDEKDELRLPKYSFKKSRRS
ncbi:hypothetical protein E1B28_003129 [Marasmius oreades]|uniref:Helicase C-terminal domain-containing protein n=1 Tax=Marasmius oreades TaxID=181124 RepID=A0A9P7RME1_9AGAR|nr:uncharacterized protein E1B28_003129 [Marasmius oreades]KAG7085573.1 hypothetical protein E1B28_003129 [Marasmius oreades]